MSTKLPKENRSYRAAEFKSEDFEMIRLSIPDVGEQKLKEIDDLVFPRVLDDINLCTELI